MDSYLKVLTELEVLLKDIDEIKIPEITSKIKSLQSTIDLYNDQRQFFAEDKEEKEYDKYVFENYKKIKSSVLLKQITKFLLSNFVVSLIFVIPNLIMSVPVSILPLIICETLISAICAKKYSDEMYEVKEIQTKYKKEPIDFKDYIEVLDLTIKEIDELIFGKKCSLELYQQDLANMQNQRKTISEYITKMKQKRDNQLEALVEHHLPELDLAFASDNKAIEILMLERKMNSGKNI